MWVVRNVVNYLRPAALNFGIVSALEWLAEDFNRRHGIRCRVVTDGDEPALPDSQASVVFRIAQESQTNVARHALPCPCVAIRAVAIRQGLHERDDVLDVCLGHGGSVAPLSIERSVARVDVCTVFTR